MGFGIVTVRNPSAEVQQDAEVDQQEVYLEVD